MNTGWQRPGRQIEAHFTVPAWHCCALLIAGCPSFSPAAAHFHFHVAQPHSPASPPSNPHLFISLIFHSSFSILLSTYPLPKSITLPLHWTVENYLISWRLHDETWLLQRATEEEIGIALEIANRADIMMFRRNKTNVELSLTFSRTDKMTAPQKWSLKSSSWWIKPVCVRAIVNLFPSLCYSK